MKKLIAVAALLATTSILAADYKGSYVCMAKELRQHSSTYNADGRLHFTKYQEGEKTLYKNIVGHLITGYDDEPEYAYYGVFKFDQKEADPKYRGRTYKNHDKLDFDAVATNGNDGGGMWGYLVINKTTEAEFDAHYVFQAGDHMGGTVDYTCKRD
ncbi:MAG: hypothetical protein KC493_05765 [Bacteriovoracaceae bacterium]|nr:hypothetical protein [Bacteriovoracaceae bacterium]